MKLSVAVLTAVLGVATAKKTVMKKEVTPKGSIKASSKIGGKLMHKARRLEQDDNEEVDFTWVADMSIKFQGCYHTQSWNEDADDNEDVRISTQRLVRFRLCPTDTCSMESAAGCSSGYGDYIISMEEYLEAYFESVQQDQEYSCEYEKEYGDCICDGENADDGFDEEICEYDCYMAKGMEYCVDGNPYNDDEEEEEEEWELREMAECKELEVDNGDRKRKLEEDEVEYFTGAYCSESGASINLGVFTDDTCTQFADEYGGAATYATLTYGKELPYSQSTMIGSECMSCKEPEDADQNNDNDNEDEDAVKEGCEQLYEAAGKCEAPHGFAAGLGDADDDLYYVQRTNEEAVCDFLADIRDDRYDATGEIVVTGGRQTQSAVQTTGGQKFALTFFAIGCFGLAGYAVLLHHKISRGEQPRLSPQDGALA